MTHSETVQESKAEARTEARAESVVAVLRARFGELPQELVSVISEISGP